MNEKLIRPGLLVSLKSTLRGGVSYAKQTIVPEHQEGEASIASWQTTREIANIAEHAAAVAVRSKSRACITRVCCPTSFGLLCPTENETLFAQAMKDAQAIADAHNATASYTRVEIYVIAGRIADNDEQAARAIAGEVRDLLRDMERGIKCADPAAIREAANKARAVSGMLSDDTGRKVAAAIAEARSAARMIVSRVEKAGEVAAQVVADITLANLQSARFAVLDLMNADDAADIVAQSDAPARPVDLVPAAMPLPDALPVPEEVYPAEAAAADAPILATPQFDWE